MEINNKRNLTIVHWNYNSINNKEEKFKYFINNKKPDIILLNETKINDLHANNIFNTFTKYNFIHRQSSVKNGGGGYRHFVVKIGTAISQISKFQTGAPQGDVLSPFLFSLFINDIPIMHKKK